MLYLFPDWRLLPRALWPRVYLFLDKRLLPKNSQASALSFPWLEAVSVEFSGLCNIFSLIGGCCRRRTSLLMKFPFYLGLEATCRSKEDGAIAEDLSFLGLEAAAEGRRMAT
jgi:hypothetical protein